MKEVTLSNTQRVVIVDNEDYDFIKAYGSWNLDNKGLLSLAECALLESNQSEGEL